MLLSFESNKVILNLLKCICEGEKRNKLLKNNVIDCNKLFLVIKKIFNKEKIVPMDIYNFIRNEIDELNENIILDDIIIMMKFNSKNFSPENNDIYFTNEDLYNIITGDYYKNEKELEYFRNYNETILYDDSSLNYETEYGVIKIFLYEIDLYKNINKQIEFIKKRNDYDLTSIYGELSNNNSFGINKFTLRDYFIRNYEWNENLSENDMKNILRRLDMNKDGEVKFSDIRKFFCEKTTLNFPKYEYTNIPEKQIKIDKRNESLNNFKIYIKQLLKNEIEIDNSKIELLKNHKDFSVGKTIFFLSPNKNFGTIYDIFLPISLLKSLFIKLNLYIKDDLDIKLISKRLHIEKIVPLTYDKLFKLLMPFNISNNEDEIIDKEYSMYKSTLIDIGNLIKKIIQLEKNLNEMKKNLGIININDIYIDLISNGINKLDKFPFISFFSFFNFMKKHNLILDKNEEKYVELIYLRMNKLNNGQLSLYEISKELEYI